MNQADVIGLVVVVGFALLVAGGAILGLGVFLQLQRSLGRWLAILAVPTMALGIAVSSLGSGRDLRYAFANIEAIAAQGSPASNWVLRVLTVLLVGMSLGAIVARLFSRGVKQRLPGAQLLIWSFGSYYVCNSILNSLFGTVPGFSHHSAYVPIVFLAMYMARGEDIRPLVHAAICALLGFMVISLVAALALPKLALQPDYKGWIPGLRSRLWGAGSNPNSIGPLALLLLLLLYLQPLRSRLLQRVAVAAALLVLLLAQSKTAWAAGIVCAASVWWLNHARDGTGRLRIGAILACVALASIAVLALMLGVGGRMIDRMMAGQIGADAATLTGRVQIWAAAMAAWRDSPVFGYGPTAWGPLHRLTIGMPYAFSAHNQFLQSLSVAGALGLGSVIAFLLTLGGAAWRARGATRGVSAGLFVLVLLRCLTEAPLSANTLFNGDMLTLLVLFRLSLVGLRPVSACMTPDTLRGSPAPVAL